MNFIGLVFLFLSFIIFIQTLSSFYSYYKNNTPKDSRYYWNVFLFIASIAGIVFSIVMIKKPLENTTDLLPYVDVDKLGAYGTQQDIVQIREGLDERAAIVKTLLENELVGKQAALDSLSNSIQAREVAIRAAEAAITTRVV